jgi:hypothetical protein
VRAPDPPPIPKALVVFNKWRYAFESKDWITARLALADLIELRDSPRKIRPA